MKKYHLPLAALTTTLISVALLLLINWPWRWIFIHGGNASKLASGMLASAAEATPEEFYDYTIYTSEKCVVFVSHDDSSKVIVYCPKGHPADTSTIGGPLLHIIGSWYRVRMSGD